MKKVIVTGATGLIGSALVPRLLESERHNVTALVRRPFSPVTKAEAGAKLGTFESVKADLQQPGPWCDALAGASAIVHLAGEPLAGKRWDARQKQLIRDSRVESTRTIVEAIAKLPAEQRPRALITASGIDYYPFAVGDTEFDDDEVTEADPPSETFLGRVCRDWEHEALAANAYGVRVVTMRTGIVMAKSGGALERMRRPFELFAGGRLGSGLQWVSWIHLDDVVAAYIAAIDDPRYEGPINLVTDSVRNADFANELGKVMHRKSWLPVPGFAIKVAVGSEFAESILQGRRVVPAKLRELGFHWQHPQLREALAASN